MRIVAVFLSVVLAGASALAQQAVPPPPRPAPDPPPAAPAPVTPAPVAPAPAPPAPAANGPSLEVTLKFIQDKVNEQGKIIYAETLSESLPGANADENASGMQGRILMAKKPAASPAFGGARRGSYGGSAADNSSPRNFVQTQVVTIDAADGELSFQEQGKGTELQKARGMTSITSDWTKTWPVYFKNVEKLEVISSTDYKHHMNPMATYQDDPPYFELVVHMASGKPVTRHIQKVAGTKHTMILESNESIQEFALHFHDEETANRVAKAMIHAIELCGGGPKPEPF